MTTLKYALAFAVICLASYLIGKAFKRIRLPTITGYLFAGALVGSFGLDLIPSSAAERLRFVDEIALAVIAFVAGSELYLKEIRQRLRPILYSTGGILVATFVLVSVAVYLLTALLPFTADWGSAARWATALLGGAVLMALSPPSTIAVIKEVQARGPFTRTALGVTVLMDVAIIVLFAIATSIASALLNGTTLSLGFVGLLALDLSLAVGLGWVTGRVLMIVLGQRWPVVVKTALVLLIGFGIYELASFAKVASTEHLGFEIYIEPLLIAMIGGFWVTNYSAYRSEFDRILHDIGPAVYVAFFTITGLALKLDILWATLPYAAALFVVRAVGIGIGASVGATLAGEPPEVRRVSWMAFITQAGIALGLAREVAVQFPDLGVAFATLIISVVVLNEVLGPLFLKAALKRTGEAHLPETLPEAGARTALLLGIEGQSVTLAHTLQEQGWRVLLADTDREQVDRLDAPSLTAHHVAAMDETTLQDLITEDISAVVALLPEPDDNLTILRFAAEHRGIERLIVRPAGRDHLPTYDTLGVFVVDPASALVTLFEQAVTSPNTTALLLHQQTGRAVAQVRVTNEDIDGLPLRDLRFPLDVLLLEIVRSGDIIVPSGHTVLQLGDEVSFIARSDSLDEVRLRLQQ